MLTLFSNGFSPFARKVAMALEYKGLQYGTRSFSMMRAARSSS